MIIGASEGPQQIKNERDPAILPHQPDVIRLLYLEDDPDDVYLIKALLNEDHLRNYSLKHVINFFQTQHQLTHQNYDALLLDLSVGQHHGLETLKQAQRLLTINMINIPIIILTGADDEILGEKAIHLGAADYLPKRHINSFNVSRSIRFALERHCLHDQLLRQARYDELTGLFNRSETMRRCKNQLEHCRRVPMSIALAIIDLDNFKPINDQYGHLAGDAILKKTGKRLEAHTRRTDVAGRIGGDEFLLLFTHFNSQDALCSLIQELHALLNQPVIVNTETKSIQIPVFCSIGATIYKPPYSLKKTIAIADKAMYLSKASESQRITFLPM